MMIVSLDQYVVVVALPDIGRELGYSPQTLQSVVSAYAIASSGFLLLGGRASDRLGRRRVLLMGVAGASVLGVTVSPDASFFALAPALIMVSVGDGIIFTAMFIAAATGVPDHQQGVASGIVSTASGIGAVVGLAVLVLVANVGTEGLTGEPLRIAVSEGIARVTYAVACGVMLMLFIVIGFPVRSGKHAGH
jgi:MFS family permease